MKHWLLPPWVALIFVLASALRPAPAGAQLAVFAGDPIDPIAGTPYSILPGRPLVSPGPDGKVGTGDEVVDPETPGDVDIVLRLGGGYGGGAIPPPAAGLDAAPELAPGGAVRGGAELPFQLILSDGVQPPPAGGALLTAEHDRRTAIAVAYADLDGDGRIGLVHGDGSADNEIERQEAYSPIGRQITLIDSGVAAGDIGVSLGGPASMGGLGVVVAGGAVMGMTGPKFFDGPWISTLLPIVPPQEPTAIIGNGGGVRPADPDGANLVEIEEEFTKWWLPSPGFAWSDSFSIPTDGSEVSVDILRSVSGPATGAAVAAVVDLAAFVAAPGRRILAAPDGAGGRIFLEDVTSLPLADDGPGGGLELAVFAADDFGNPTDPPPDGITVSLEAGSALRIVAPDNDGNPSIETFAIVSAAPLIVLLDDSGAAEDAPARDRLLVTTGGVPVDVLDVEFAAGVPQGPLSGPRSRLRLRQTAGGDRVRFRASFVAAPDLIDPTKDEVEVRLADQDGVVFYSRVFPAGSLEARRGGRRFVFRDDSAVESARVRRLVLARRRTDPSQHLVRLTVTNLDLGVAASRLRGVLQTVRIGKHTFTAEADCAPNARLTAVRCGA